MSSSAKPDRVQRAGQDQVASSPGVGDETLVARTASQDTRGAAFGPPHKPDEVGTLGPYRIVKQLGRGGMGAVFAAIDTRLNRKVALKVMLPEYAADASSKERFLREARAAAQITHDNVVTVYEADERDGVPYIAMQMLEGYPLDAYLKKKGTPPLAHIVRIAREAAAGLAAAHKIGLVHRDIKPGNLWLEAPHGRVKVLDFGLARSLDTDVELTKSGAILGTPAYMAPEQARGDRVDHRTDLFSLGALLYKLCAGRLPFDGPTTMAVLMALSTKDPQPIRELNPQVSESLATLIHQLLAKEPDARPQSADEVVKRLKSIDRQPGGSGISGVEATTALPAAAPMQVTIQPEAAAFPVITVAKPKPQVAAAKQATVNRQWLLIAAGLGLLLIAAACGVIVIVRLQDGTETKIEVPDGSKVTVGQKDGKPVVEVDLPGGAPQPALGGDADRKAAEWVLSLGGSVRVSGQDHPIDAIAELPTERFALTSVILIGKPVTGSDLARLAGLADLQQIDLGSVPVKDADLAHFKKLPRLADLQIYGTQITDAGLEHVKDLKGLKSLGLAGTKVTDSGLTRLKGLRSLTYLNVTKTEVTPPGLEDLHAAVPGCRIEHDGGIIAATAPAPSADPDRDVVNWVIKVGGTVGVNGKGGWFDTSTGAMIPDGPIRVIAFGVDQKAVGDDDLRLVSQLQHLSTLNISRTAITDAGLAHLERLPKLELLYANSLNATDKGVASLENLPLRKLHFSDSKITDASLPRFARMPRLDELYIISTPGITDEGLAALAGSQSLRSLNVSRTKVTEAGVKKLAAAIPRCRIDWNGGIIERTVPTYAALLPVPNFEWTAPQTLGSEVNVGRPHNFCARLSADGLELWFVASPGDGGTDIWVAGRKSPTDPWEAAILARPPVSTGQTETGLTFPADGLLLVVASNPVTDASGERQFFELTRTANDAPWSEPVQVRYSLGATRPVLAPDGLEIFFHPDKKPAHRSSRVSRDAAWGDPVPVIQFDRSPEWFSPDGHWMIGSSQEADGQIEFWLSHRGTVGGPWGARQKLDLPQGFTKISYPFPLLTPAGLELYFAHEGKIHVARRVLKANAAQVQSPQADQRGAAEWVLSQGGTVHVSGTERDIKNAAELPAGPLSLTWVDLKNLPVTDADLANLRGCDQLTLLVLHGTRVTDAGLVHFQGCRNLVSLSLHGTNVTDAGVANFKECAGLQGLYLFGTKVTDAGLANFQAQEKITNLSLGGKGVTDAGLANFKNCRRIQTLYLSGTAITDAGLAHFQHCQKLQTLWLNDTGVTDAGLSLLKDCPQLTDLNLTQTQVTAAEATELSQALPQCRIRHDGGTIEPKR